MYQGLFVEFVVLRMMLTCTSVIALDLFVLPDKVLTVELPDEDDSDR